MLQTNVTLIKKKKTCPTHLLHTFEKHIPLFFFPHSEYKFLKSFHKPKIVAIYSSELNGRCFPAMTWVHILTLFTLSLNMSRELIGSLRREFVLRGGLVIH